MIKKLSAIVLALAFAVVLYAQGAKSIKVTGYLIDNACADSAKDLGARAKTHSTSCALMDSCETSGYSVVTDDNKRYPLTDAGNDKAAELLKNSKTQKGVKVVAEGEYDGTKLDVKTLTEATETVN
jgi:hypothetical protein